jgi:hypothetical protein
MRSEMEPGWEDRVAAACDQMLGKVGEQIASDAQRYAPVRSGKLRESISHKVEAHELVVEASAAYAAYVEMGHRIAHGPHMREVGPKVKAPHPFLRPALYQERSE